MTRITLDPPCDAIESDASDQCLKDDPSALRGDQTAEQGGYARIIHDALLRHVDRGAARRAWFDFTHFRRRHDAHSGQSIPNTLIQ